MASASSELPQNELHMAFTCAVCLDIYDAPKMLPNCGHSFCLKCIKNMAKSVNFLTRVVCPECRAESTVTCGVELLKTNVAISRAVDIIRPGGKDGDGERKTACQHVFISKTQTLCEHCHVKFCEGCLFRHMEELRMTIMCSGSGFPQRLQKANEGLENKLDEIKKFLGDQVETTEKQIDEAYSRLKELMTTELSASKGRLMEEARSHSKAALAQIESIIAVANQDSALLQHQVEQSNNTSILQLSLDGLVGLRKQVSKRDEEIATLEQLQSDKVTNEFVEFKFKMDESVLQHFSEKLAASEKTALVLKSYQTKKLPQTELTVDEYRLHNAALCGDLSTVKEILGRASLPPAGQKHLLEHKNVTNTDRTVLLEAADEGQLDVVRFLVEDQKANIYARDGHKNRPMAVHLAATSGRTSVVEFLTNFAPDLVETKDAFGDTPIALAVWTGELSVVKFLVESKNANLETKNSQGRTPLLDAVDRVDLQMVRYLAGKSANINARDTTEQGDMAIHLAVCFESLDITKYLLELDPKLTMAVNGKGETPLQLAEKTGNAEIISLLKKSAINIYGRKVATVSRCPKQQGVEASQ